MAKDDYHFVVFQILSYLYQCLKNGERVNPKNLERNNKYFQINENYWKYIMFHLYDMGYIEGIGLVELDGMEYPLPVQLEDCRITPSGIEYVCENSTMQKVKKFIKSSVEIVTQFL